METSDEEWERKGIAVGREHPLVIDGQKGREKKPVAFLRVRIYSEALNIPECNASSCNQSIPPPESFLLFNSCQVQCPLLTLSVMVFEEILTLWFKFYMLMLFPGVLGSCRQHILSVHRQ